MAGSAGRQLGFALSQVAVRVGFDRTLGAPSLSGREICRSATRRISKVQVSCSGPNMLPELFWLVAAIFRLKSSFAYSPQFPV